MTDWRVAAERFCADMTALCIMFRASETSGARTPARNRSKGGHPKSKHLTELGGLARDFVFHSVIRRDAAKEWAQSRGYHTYIGPDYGPMRLHVQYIEYGVDPLTVLSNIPEQDNSMFNN